MYDEFGLFAAEGKSIKDGKVTLNQKELYHNIPHFTIKNDNWGRMWGLFHGTGKVRVRDRMTAKGRGNSEHSLFALRPSSRVASPLPQPIPFVNRL